MNNRKAYRQWLEKEKKYNSRLCRLNITNLESLDRDFHVFETQEPESLDNLVQSEYLMLYKEFLRSMKPYKEEIVTHDELELTNELNIIEEQTAGSENKELFEQNENIKYIIEQNTLFKNSISSLFEPITQENEKTDKEAESVYDITSSRLIDLKNQVFSEPMQKYVFFELDKRIQRTIISENGFYYSNPEGLIRLGSCANAFYENADENNTIIGDALDDSHNKKMQSLIRKPICLVPDNLGDFGDNIKRQLKSIKNRVIQIPRSIAAIYQLIENNAKIESTTRVLCLDYNSRHLCRTEVIIGTNEDGSLKIVRMGRRQINNRIAFDELANQYIDDYCIKNGFEIMEIDRDNLILSRDIIDVIKDHKSIIVNTKSGYKSIAYDSKIALRISQIIQEDINREKESQYDYVIGLSDFVSNDTNIFDLESLHDGLKRICNKIDNKETIWVEYLPKLDLETVKNGKFEWISLISDKEREKMISEESMENDEGIIIEIPDNKVFFPAEQDIIYLPLKRDSFGEIGVKDKLAKFEDKKILPLNDSIHVELKLSYHYGDPDSYKLIATAVDNSDISITSSWCNEDEQIMGNDKVPDYSSPIIKNKANEYDICESIGKTMRKFTYPNSFVGSPFEEKTGFHNWNALWEMSQVRMSIPIVFEPNNILKIASNDMTVIEIVENYVERLVEIFYSASNRSIDWNNCNFNDKQYDYLMTNMANQLSMLGGFVESDVFENKYLADEIVNCVFNSPNINNFLIMYIMQLSTHISRDNDTFGVWNRIDELASRSIDVVKRTIGSICWRNENWIYEFGKIDEKTLSKITKKIIIECKNGLSTLKATDNPTWLRDELETLLSLTRLKICVPIMRDILDCNNPDIKDLVSLLKEFNNNLYEQSWHFEPPFVGRVQLSIPQEFSNVHSVLYPLIEILTDGNAIKLTGYDSDVNDNEISIDSTNAVEQNIIKNERRRINKEVVLPSIDSHFYLKLDEVHPESGYIDELDIIISQSNYFTRTSLKGLKEMLKYLKDYTSLLDGSECGNISTKRATEEWPKGHYVIIPKLGINIKGITGGNTRQNEQLIEVFLKVKESWSNNRNSSVKSNEMRDDNKSTPEDEIDKKTVSGFDSDERKNEETKIANKARKLTAGLDIEGMNNEKLRGNAKFLKVYTDLIDLLQQNHPELAEELHSFGDDYISKLICLRKYYK